KQHVRNLMSTDMAREYKKLSKEHGQVKEKYSGIVERFNEIVNDYNELIEENKSLKSKIRDLKCDVSFIYEMTKVYLSELTDDIKTKKNEFELNHNREVKKERSRDQGMSL